MVSANASEIFAGVTVPTNKPTPTERPSLRAWLVHSTMSNASMRMRYPVHFMNWLFFMTTSSSYDSKLKQ